MVTLRALKNIRHSCGTIYAGQNFDVEQEMVERYIDGGIAIPEDGQWHGLEWQGDDVVILASGPSLSLVDVEAVEKWRKSETGRRVIVVNSTFRMAPWADVLYAGDRRWWVAYKDLLDVFEGERWSAAIGAKLFGAKYIHSELGNGLGTHPGVIRLGRNSGYQAVNLAYQAGARRIILLGFDCRDINGLNHWHGEHPPAMKIRLDYAEWIKAFGILAEDLKKQGVEVINCTPDSALTCFRKRPLEEVVGFEVTTVGDDVIRMPGDSAASGVLDMQEEVGEVDNTRAYAGIVPPMGETINVGSVHDSSGSGVSEGSVSDRSSESRISDYGSAESSQEQV